MRRPRHAETGLLGEVLDRRRAFLYLHLVNSSDRFFVADEATKTRFKPTTNTFGVDPLLHAFEQLSNPYLEEV